MWSPRARGCGIALLAAALFAFLPTTASAQLRAPVRDAQRVMQRDVWSWKELQERNIVMQKRDFSCGAAALATLMQYYWGDQITEHQILKQFDTLLTQDEVRDRIENGLTLTDLRRVSVKMGYLSTIGTLRFDQLVQSKVPVIVGLTVGEFKHFVVFRGAYGDYVYLADSARGNIRVPVNDFVKQWQKNAVLVVAKPKSEPKTWSPLSVREDEVYQGHLNRVEIQKQLGRSVVRTPLSLR